jgi:hypothetical protein
MNCDENQPLKGRNNIGKKNDFRDNVGNAVAEWIVDARSGQKLWYLWSNGIGKKGVPNVGIGINRW